MTRARVPDCICVEAWQRDCREHGYSWARGAGVIPSGDPEDSCYTCAYPPAPTHTLNEYGTTDCPVERVRAFADDGECSSCGGRVFPPESDAE